MSELIKVSPKICQKCKYHMGFGAQPGREQRVVSNVCCNYADIEGHSRIFENGVRLYDPAYCDKFDPGTRKKGRSNITVKRNNYDEYSKYKFKRISEERGISL